MGASNRQQKYGVNPSLACVIVTDLHYGAEAQNQCDQWKMTEWKYVLVISFIVASASNNDDVALCFSPCSQ